MCFTGVLPCQCCNTGFCNNGRIKYKVSDTKNALSLYGKSEEAIAFLRLIFLFARKFKKT